MTMKYEGEIDPLADDIFERIDPKIRDSLSPTQLSAISEAVRTSGSGTFLINFRGVIPFFFAKYYFVFLLGRDHTAVRRKTETFRRQRYSLMGGIMFAFLVGLPFFLLLLTFLYLLKYVAGVDFVPNFHIYDIFR